MRLEHAHLAFALRRHIGGTAIVAVARIRLRVGCPVRAAL